MTGTSRLAGRLAEPGVLGAFDDDDVLTALPQGARDRHAEGAQAHDHRVAGHAAGPRARCTVRKSAGDEHIGEERHDNGGCRHASEHQQNRPHLQPRRLRGEVEVAVTHGRDRLAAEVQRVENTHAGFSIATPQHDRRDAQQRGEHCGHPKQIRVGVADEGLG